MIDRTFIDDLASTKPAPGSVGAAAYCGALATAMAKMVANLTVGKERYADVEDLMYNIIDELDESCETLLELIEEDEEAFLPLHEAFRMAGTNPEEIAVKDHAMQKALIGAIETPLAIMHECSRVILMVEKVAHHGSGLPISDAGAAAVLAGAALRACSLNVQINAKSLNDERMARRYTRKADEMMAIYGPKADAIVNYVMWRVRYE